MDVYRPPSVFVLKTPYEGFGLGHDLSTPPFSDSESLNYIDCNTHPIISFDFRAPFGIEPVDIFELDINGETVGGYPVTVVIAPIELSAEDRLGPLNNTENMYGMQAAVTGFDDGSLEVTVAAIDGLLNGSWHNIWINFEEAVKAAIDVFDAVDSEYKEDWYIARLKNLTVSGRMFRLDNIIFRARRDAQIIDAPDLFEMGPLYAEIFKPYRYLFIADYLSAGAVIHDVDGNKQEYRNITDLMLNPGNFIFMQDPNDPNDPVAQYWKDLGADPNLFGENDPNLAKNVFERDSFVVDLSLPIFADSNMRISGPAAKSIINQGILSWGATVGGYGANGVQLFQLSSLPIYPYDGIPTYLPSRYSVMDVIKTYGKPYYSPELVFMLEGALWNAGFTNWPNIAVLDFEPQYFEDLIITIGVTNGLSSDVRTFPISVVNFPVENYPPVLQLDIEDQTFYINEIGEYHVNFIDPDCFIFSMSSDTTTTHVPGFPITESYRADMDELNWNITFNGLASYQYGKWIENIINPDTGLISFIPTNKGRYEAVITCEDLRGGTAFGEIIISCSYPSVNGSNLYSENHSPVITEKPETPIIIKAGQEVVLAAPDIGVYDPDGDKLFASSNIGNITRHAESNFTWDFLTYFPGIYQVQITFFDRYGKYKSLEFIVEVRPWWSY